MSVEGPSPPGTKTGTGYSAQVSDTSETWPVPVENTQNGRGVLAGGIRNSSPSFQTQTTMLLPGTHRRTLYPVGAVGVVANVDQTRLIGAGSIVGGQLGAVVGRRMSPLVFRFVVVGVGLIVSLKLLLG